MTEAFMDQDTFNLGIRKFLKTVGVASQREIEQAVAKAVADGTIAGTETLSVMMTLTVDALQLERTFDGKIALE
jgi:ribosomal protein L1